MVPESDEVGAVRGAEGGSVRVWGWAGDTGRLGAGGAGGEELP